MIIKFRDNTINMLRKNNRDSQELIDQEKAQLQEELAELRKQLECHPEVTRFAAENLELRGTIFNR